MGFEEMASMGGWRRVTSGAVAALALVFLVPQLGWAESAGEGEGTPPGPRIRFVKNEQGVRGVRLTAYFRTTPDVLWEVVTNPRKAASLFDRMKAIRPSKRGSDYREYHLTSVIGDKLVICRIERDDRRRRIEWKRVSGDLRELAGFYHIRASKRFAGYSRLDYASFIDPGRFLRHLMTDRGRRRDVMTMVARIRRYVEGSAR